MVGHKAVLFYALLSVLLTAAMGLLFALTVFSDVAEVLAFRDGVFNPPLWLPVLIMSVSAAFSVSILSILTLRLIREVKIRDESLQKTEHERLSFAADVAHELRTPLAILRARIDNFDAVEDLQKLREDVDHIARIIEQFLVKSRIEALGVKPGEQADLAQICLDVAAYMAPLVIKEGRTIEVIGADEGPCFINGNAFAIQQAVRNLLENAVKYSQRGSVITLQLKSVRGEKQLRVIDRGRGVPEDRREIIFERFHRADRRGQGAGLGLSIVQRVAENHGGKVTISDAPGGGASFNLHFPDNQ